MQEFPSYIFKQQMILNIIVIGIGICLILFVVIHFMDLKRPGK